MVKFLEQRNLEVWVTNKVWKIYGASNQALKTGIQFRFRMEVSKLFNDLVVPYLPFKLVKAPTNKLCIEYVNLEFTYLSDSQS